MLLTDGIKDRLAAHPPFYMFNLLLNFHQLTFQVLLPGSITWEKRSSLPWEAYDLRGATLPHFFDKGGEILVAGGTDNSFLQRGEVGKPFDKKGKGAILKKIHKDPKTEK